MLSAALLNFKSACVCVFFCVGDYGPWACRRAHTVTAGLFTQQISGVGTSSLSPAASCRWGTLIFNRRSSRVPRWATFGWRCSLQACDSSTGGEQCVIHIVLHTEACGLKKGGVLGEAAAMMFDVMWTWVGVPNWSAVCLMAYMGFF